ncbi:expressed protein [Phakopsora pachyrhizi]|uniref:Expressed protein n=1 Tax=Phakopsora pachyrhizi TaxID=170000 RepID=A0AAV0BKB7_PHAPC|nr:expressed protein [Phakopsora pachyrhizi]
MISSAKVLGFLFIFLNSFHSLTSAPAEEAKLISKVGKAPRKPYATFLSGTLAKPKNGAHFVNQGGAMGNIQLQYKCPNSLAVTEVGERTVSIDVVLVPISEGSNPGSNEIVLARGLRAKIGEDGEMIDTNFVPPATVCGDYRMVVTEKQIFNNAVVQFAAGAPIICEFCLSHGQS